MLFQPLMLGILLFQVLYSLVQWLYSRRNEFIYYACYSVILACYFYLKLQSVDGILKVGGLKLRENVLDRQLIYFAIFVYVEFARLVLGNATYLSGMAGKVKLARRLMLGYILLSTVWSLVSDKSVVQEVVHVFFSALTFSFFVLVLVMIFRSGSTIGRLLAWGSLIMGIGAMTALVFRIAAALMGYQLPFHPIIFFEVGVICELVCLNAALIYKTKKRNDKAHAASIAKANEQASELQAIRAEISDELRAELIDGLSDIKNLSDAVQRKTGSLDSPELKRISENSEKLIKSMNEIVWSLNQRNDKLENVITYLNDYAQHLMHQVNLKCTVTVPDEIPDILVYSEARRNIFLAFKEAVHNVVKHSGATEVAIHFSISDYLHISVKDNGKGVDTGSGKSPFGNGLRNMQKRMKLIKGEFTMNAVEGTHIVFSVPLAQITYRD